MFIPRYGILLTLAISLALPLVAADSPRNTPAGFSFAGSWSCSGNFVRSGKTHRSTYEGRALAGDNWIELTEQDIEPKGYIGHYLIGYDASQKQMVELDANSAGYAVYTSPGWADGRLTLTSTGAVSYKVPKNRFVFHVVAPDAFDVTWETQNGSAWAASDQLSCRRANHAESDGEDLPSSAYLQPHLQPAQKYANVFSRTIAYQAAGVDDLVKRVSGTAEYTVVESSPGAVTFDGKFLYDGRPLSTGKTEVRDNGGTSCWRDQCSTATDASGLLYNAHLWGSPSGMIRTGMTWDVTIAEPWELGPAGTQKVTVLSTDPADHSVTLQREGSGDGYFDHDAKQVHVTKGGKTYTADLNPGTAHWVGRTTFREGIVISDELLVERPVTLVSKDLGSISGTQREYILLNAMPVSSL